MHVGFSTNTMIKGSFIGVFKYEMWTVRLSTSCYLKLRFYELELQFACLDVAFQFRKSRRRPVTVAYVCFVVATFCSRKCIVDLSSELPSVCTATVKHSRASRRCMDFIPAKQNSFLLLMIRLTRHCNVYREVRDMLAGWTGKKELRVFNLHIKRLSAL